MPAPAYGLPFLMTSGAAVIAVGPAPPARPCASHTGAAGSAGSYAGEKRRAVYDPWRPHPWIVAHKPCVDLFQKCERDDWWDFDLDDGGGVVQAAGAGVTAPIRPFARRVVTAPENAMERTNAKG